MAECLFCKIIKKEIPSQTIFENSDFLVLKDIFPKAPLHLLIIPKKHIISVSHLEEGDKELVGEMFLLAKKIAEEQGTADSGYRLIFNVGRDSGQTIDHLHLHLMGGGQLSWS